MKVPHYIFFGDKFIIETFPHYVTTLFLVSLDKTLVLYLCAMVRAGIVHVHDQV